MRFELNLVRVHDLAAAVLALLLGSATSLGASEDDRQRPSKRNEDAHNRRRLWSLDGQPIGLDWRASAGLFGFLVLALDLRGESKLERRRTAW
jgi:hypothetical protein